MFYIFVGKTRMEKQNTIVRSKLTLVNEDTAFYSPKISQSKSAKEYADFARSLFESPLNFREEFHVILLNNSSAVIGFSKISEGGYSGTVADAKMIFSTALLHTNAQALILVHNHPSGSLHPSENDIKTTDNLVKFGAMIDMNILDHLIITEDGYYSFADSGLI